MDEQFQTLTTEIVVGEDRNERLDRVSKRRDPETKERMKRLLGPEAPFFLSRRYSEVNYSK